MKVKKINSGKSLDFYSAELDYELEIPLMSSPISAGFPSPAEDYIDLSLDLNKALIDNASSTFYARVKGMSMKDAGIEDGDILIIDRSKDVYSGATAVCFLDGDFTTKKIQKKGSKLFLMPANEQYKPIEITEDNEFVIWGIVTYVIKKL